MRTSVRQQHNKCGELEDASKEKASGKRVSGDIAGEATCEQQGDEAARREAQAQDAAIAGQEAGSVGSCMQCKAASKE